MVRGRFAGPTCRRYGLATSLADRCARNNHVAVAGSPGQSQLEEAGFASRFTCEDTGCGGFDFRFATDVLPAPDMYVDLGDFRFIAFEKSGVGGPSLISLFASRTASSGYVQITSVSAEGTAPQVAPEAPAIRTTGPALSGDLIANLEQTGRFILSDLTFETGSAQLGEADFSSLARLANYLLDNPNRTIALVGHTDSVGSLDGNIALSKRRAGSVLERLVTAFGVPRRQLEADGVGYLTPIATNLTEEGRDQNRRVEAILTSTE